MKDTYTIVLCILVVFLSLFPATQTVAQSSSYKLSIQKDSLIAPNDSKVLFNAVSVTNQTKKTIRVGLSIKIPVGWKNLLDKQGLFENAVLYSLPPGGTKEIPLNLMKQNNATANWDSVKISAWIWELGRQDTGRTNIHLRAEARYKFVAKTPEKDILLGDKPTFIELPLYLKNTGNITDEYKLRCQNVYLEVDQTTAITLAPGQDTTYTLQFPISPATWTQLYQQQVSVAVSGTEKSSLVVYNLARSKSVYKAKKSAYKTMPVTLEGGSVWINEQKSYYGGIKGGLDLGDQRNLSFYYRTRQYGTMFKDFYQPNMINLTYTDHKLQLMAGRLAPPVQYFIYTGYGATATYNFSDSASFSVGAYRHDPNFLGVLNDGVSANANYHVKKLNISQVALVNHDAINNSDAVVVENNVGIIRSDNMNFSVKAGASVEEQRADTMGNMKSVPGYILGYTFNYKLEKWRLGSTIDMNSKNTPGVFRGRKWHLHEITRDFDKYYAGVFYRANYVTRNYFRDSLYNTDILQYNLTTYGIRMGKAGAGKQQFNVNFGLAQNSAKGESINNMTALRYFFGGNYSLRILGNSLLYFNTLNTLQRNLLTTTNSFTFNNRHVGLNLSYTSTANPQVENGSATGGVERTETIMGGPNVNFQFHRRVFGSVRYGFFKTTQDVKIRHGFGGALSYNNSRAGFTIQASGFFMPDNTVIAGTDIQDMSTAQISIVKRLNIPVPFHKKYHDLSAKLYYDVNNNGMWEEGETAIPDAVFEINDKPLRTNKDGVGKFKNIDDGKYQVDMSNTDANGLIPVDGSIQYVKVEGTNTKIEIPFKAGKVIEGNIKVINDEFSHANMTPDNIKVTATDTTGKTFSTLTDGAGNFKMYVPAGIFTVSLNPRAFEDSDFKPEKIAFSNLDLMSQKEVEVKFVIAQKTRKVRFLNDTK